MQIMSSTTCFFLSFLSFVLEIPATQAASPPLVKLIPYNSVNSPYFNPTATSYELAEVMFEASISRLAHLRQHQLIEEDFEDAPKSQIFAVNYVPIFLVLVSVGDQQQLLAMDTGSGLSWVHCSPNNGKLAVKRKYNTFMSHTYKELSCSSVYCSSSIFNMPTDCMQDMCFFKIGYGTGHIMGRLLYEKFDFISRDETRIEFPTVAFGCAHDATEDFARMNGVLGLGAWNISILSQQKITTFSYCLGNLSDLSYDYNVLIFGPAPQDDEPKFDVTPLTIETGHYYVNIEAIYVGATKLQIDKEQLRRNRTGHTGGAVIDSGASFTILQDIAYEPLEQEVLKILSFIQSKRLHDYDSSRGMHCFFGNMYQDLENFPMVSISFEGGAALDLNFENLFQQVNSDKFCFNVLSSATLNFSESVIGVNFQQFFLLEFDLYAMTVRMAPYVCEYLFEDS